MLWVISKATPAHMGIRASREGTAIYSIKLLTDNVACLGISGLGCGSGFVGAGLPFLLVILCM